MMRYARRRERSGKREREERDEFGDWRLTESSTRRGRWMSRAQMPKHVRVFAMWFIFRMIGAVIRSFFSKPPAPVEKKMVVECETAEAFAEALAEAKAAKRPVVVDFTATWCGPCQRVAPIYADMSETYDAMFLKVDVDKNSAVSGAHQVTAMPTFAFYSADGEPHDEKIRGANVQKIVETLEKLGAKKVAKEAKKDA